MRRNLRHERFAALMTKPGMTAAAAYHEVYPRASEATAATEGPALLRKPHVAALVAKHEAKQLERIDATAEDVKRELSRIAKVDVALAFDRRGRRLPLNKIPEDVRRAISGIDDGKLRFWSKTEALNLLAKHHGLLREIIEVQNVTETRDISDDEWEKLAALEHKVRGDAA